MGISRFSSFYRQEATKYFLLPKIGKFLFRYFKDTKFPLRIFQKILQEQKISVRSLRRIKHCLKVDRFRD